MRYGGWCDRKRIGGFERFEERRSPGIVSPTKKSVFPRRYRLGRGVEVLRSDRRTDPVWEETRDNVLRPTDEVSWTGPNITYVDK